MTARMPALFLSASQTLAHCHWDRNIGALHLFPLAPVFQDATDTYPSEDDKDHDMILSAKRHSTGEIRDGQKG